MRTRLVVLLALTLAGCGSVGNWFGGSTGSQPAGLVEFKPEAELSEVWKAGVGADGSYAFPPHAEGDDVFAAGGTRAIRVALANGRVVWRHDAAARLSAGVGVGQGLVLVGSNEGEMIALDRESGQLKWKAKLASEAIGTPLTTGDTAIIRSGDGRVQGLALTDGSRKWVYSRSLPSLALRGSGGLTLADGVLYAGFPGGKLVALDPANGAQFWEATVALPRGATELERVADVMGRPVVDEKQVCAVAFQGRVACFDRASGALLWSRETSSNSGLAMDAQNVYVSDDKDAVTAYDKTSGRPLWRQDKLARRQITAPLALGVRVVVADAEGFVHVLAADDGRFVARTRLGDAVRTVPVDIGPGFAVQTVQGSVVALRLK